MPALSNVALTDTFDTWRIRTNQVIIKGNEEEIRVTNAYDRANATGTGANAFTSATVAGANTAVGAGANAFTSATVAGANTAVGAGANAFTSATVAGANTAVGAGANAFIVFTISGANTAVGTGANAFTSATVAGANTAVGTGANAFTSATVAGANAFTSATVAGANTAVGTGANTVGSAAFTKANNALANTTGAVFNGILYITTNVGIGLTSSPAANLHVVGDIVATGDITSAFSDERLKDIIKPINDAVDKVKTLDTFYYRPNKTAIDLGLNDQIQIGLSAQQVQNVLPEIVKPSVVGKGYLTVQYERVVPLLIEAIKELTNRIEKLEDGTKNRKCNCRK